MTIRRAAAAMAVVIVFALSPATGAQASSPDPEIITRQREVVIRGATGFSTPAISTSTFSRRQTSSPRIRPRRGLSRTARPTPHHQELGLIPHAQTPLSRRPCTSRPTAPSTFIPVAGRVPTRTTLPLSLRSMCMGRASSPSAVMTLASLGSRARTGCTSPPATARSRRRSSCGSDRRVEDDWLSVQDVADALRAPRPDGVADGSERGPPWRARQLGAGACVTVRRADVDAYIERSKVTPGELAHLQASTRSRGREH